MQGRRIWRVMSTITMTLIFEGREVIVLRTCTYHAAAHRCLRDGHIRLRYLGTHNVHTTSLLLRSDRHAPWPSKQDLPFAAPFGGLSITLAVLITPPSSLC